MTKLLIILAIVVMVTLAGVYIAHQRAGRLTNETTATVVRATVRQLGIKDNGRYETEVFYKYTVGGQSYEARSTKQGRADQNYPIGMKGRVKFNPQKPEEADVMPSD